MRILDRFIRSNCELCQSNKASRGRLCSACEDELPQIECGCEVCSLPLPPGGGPVCGQCQSRPPDFRRLVAACRYAAPVDHLISELKYKGKLSNALILGQLLARHVSRELCLEAESVLLPMPLHSSRLRERGFNQSLEIARSLARELDISLMPDLASRVRATRAQSGLSAGARQSNVRGAFRVNEQFALPKHIILLDDVVTTTATMRELARTLARAGATELLGLSVARAV